MSVMQDMDTRVNDAGENTLENVPNVALVAHAPPTAYGLVGTTAGHRIPKNPIVSNDPITPIIETGANDDNDFNLQRGYRKPVVTARMALRRDTIQLGIPGTMPCAKLLKISPRIKLKAKQQPKQ